MEELRSSFQTINLSFSSALLSFLLFSYNQQTNIKCPLQEDIKPLAEQTPSDALAGLELRDERGDHLSESREEGPPERWFSVPLGLIGTGSKTNTNPYALKRGTACTGVG